jgi:hypothetical protein
VITVDNPTPPPGATMIDTTFAILASSCNAADRCAAAFALTAPAGRWLAESPGIE